MSSVSTHADGAGPDRLTLAEAVAEGLHDEMDCDDVVILGEAVGESGGVFRATDGLIEAFGEERVIDTPLGRVWYPPLGHRAGIVGDAAGRRTPALGFIHPDPVVVLEPKLIYRAFREEVPTGPFELPLGQASYPPRGVGRLRVHLGRTDPANSDRRQETIHGRTGKQIAGSDEVSLGSLYTDLETAASALSNIASCLKLIQRHRVRCLR